MKKLNKITVIIIFISVLTIIAIVFIYCYQFSKNKLRNVIDTSEESTVKISSSTRPTNVNLILVTSTVAIPSTTDIMTPKEMQKYGAYHRAIYEVTRDKNGEITNAKLIGLTDPQPLKLDLMTNSEKEAIKMPTSTKVQVLERDSSGKIIKYRLMKSDTDIMRMY